MVGFGRAARALLAALTLVASVVSGPGVAVAGPTAPVTSQARAAAAGDPPATWRSVSAGLEHACAVATEGTLWCWGANVRGDLGNGSRSQGSEQPQRVGTEATWVSVSSGRHTSCGRRVDASLWCWGDNVLGATGTGPADLMVLTPRQVEPGSAWGSVSTAGSSTCGVRLDGSAWCWGDNTYGQLGTTVPGAAPTPVRLAGPTGWRQVSVGLRRGCGVAQDGGLWCWGGSSTTLTAPERVGDGADWVEVSLSRTDVPGVRQRYDDPYGPRSGGPPVPEGCARRSSGAVACWVGRTDSPAPVEVAGLAGATGVDVGPTSSCATTTSQGVRCWGFGYDGQLGAGTRLDSREPAPVLGTTAAAGAAPWRSVTVGDRFACGLDGDATLSCWGRRALGVAGLQGAQLPVRLGTASPVTGGGPVGGWSTIVPSQDHTCGIGVDRTLWCWGDASGGVLGQGPLWWRAPTPLQIGVERAWRSVSVSRGRSCAIATDSSMWCWGHGYSWAPTGTGSGLPSDDVPTRVLPGSTWESVELTNEGSCAIRVGGDVSCWGWQGVLGLGGPDPVRSAQVPAPIGRPHGSRDRIVAAQLSVATRGCAVAVDAHLWCWGRSRPLASGDRTWRSVVMPSSEYYGSMCAIATDDTLWCGAWYRLVQVPGSWTQVTAEQGSRCAIDTGGGLWCWGDNQRGVTGSGGRQAVPAPTRVGDRRWVSVTMNGATVCAVDTDHVGWCWGDNRLGQVGDGTTTERRVPTTVQVAA